ncbi:MAG: M23 family metallopeptidase [Acidobacteriota bacterium]
MKLRSSSSRSGRRSAVAIALLVLVAALGVAVWGALRQGPAPSISIETERPAIGASTRVTARFAEPRGGLGAVKLELLQGDRTVVLGERVFARPGAYALGGAVTPEASIEAVIGRKAQEWLKEGQATLRATADRMAGPLRSPSPVTVERTLAVRLRPPALAVLSSQHHVRQGGSGMVRLRVGESAARSGVRAGAFESPSAPLDGGAPGERFVLFAVPWTLADGNAIRAFAEDDAGNRAEASFVTTFRPSPPRLDTIEVSDGFLEKVVPPIAAATEGFDASGSLLEQYVRINRDLRVANLAEVARLAGSSEPRFLWRGAFLQMPNSEKRANFAETRSYRYQGRDVDRQTHLGLDLASRERDTVPAPNSGRVVLAGWLGIYGNAVAIDHGHGLLTLCGHMSSLSVTAGDVVKKGQPIGLSGATGLAGGDHLHLEFFLHGLSVSPIEWLDAHWIRDALSTKAPVPVE